MVFLLLKDLECLEETFVFTDAILLLDWVKSTHNRKFQVKEGNNMNDIIV